MSLKLPTDTVVLTKPVDLKSQRKLVLTDTVNSTPRPVTTTVLVKESDLQRKDAVVARDSKNASSNSTTSSGNNGVATGVSLGLAGVLAVGAALVI